MEMIAEAPMLIAESDAATELWRAREAPQA